MFKSDKEKNEYGIAQFREQFPNEDKCLEYLLIERYGKCGCPNCGIDKTLRRVKNRRSFQCTECTYQVYPTANTIFDKTTTPLTYWFYAIFLYSATRNGVAAKELQRQLGVSYTTALRMSHLIRSLMADNSDTKLNGVVSADETYFGQLGKNMHKSKKGEGLKRGKANKVGVLGMIDNKGNVKTEVLQNDTYLQVLKDNIEPNSVVITDNAYAYLNAKLHFKEHVIVDHSKDKYSKNGFSTNNIENYWSGLKRMIKGTHIHVSKKYLHNYVAENTFRYVHRAQGGQMFNLILDRVKLVKGGNRA